jgi:cysteine-rich repeat protein
LLIIRSWVFVGAIAAVVVGCVDTQTQRCGAFVCSEASVCSPDGERCVLPSQLDACAGHAAGESCSYPGTSSGACDGAVCVPAGCGNGVVEPASEETCDDGNRNSLDGCSADCRSDERCGDGVADLAIGETCDCGDGSMAVAGCSGPNSDAPGAQCRSLCTLARCGDGVRDPVEQCDDGNTVPGDGCRADCAGRWTEMPTDTFAYLGDVWGSAPDDVFAVGARKILHYDGVAWTSQALPDPLVYPPQFYVAVWGTASNNVYALGNQRLDHYDGTSWTTSYTLPFAGRAIWGSAANDIWIGGYNAAQSLAHWNGIAWTVDQVNTVPVLDLWGSAANDVYAIRDYDGTGTQLYLFHFDGAQWDPVLPAGSTDPQDTFGAGLVFGTSATDVYAFDDYDLSAMGPLLHHRVGSAWTTAGCCDELAAPAFGIGGVAGDILLVGDQGHILRNDGTTWSISRTPTDASLKAVWSSSVNHAFVVGSNGTILY